MFSPFVLQRRLQAARRFPQRLQAGQQEAHQHLSALVNVLSLAQLHLQIRRQLQANLSQIDWIDPHLIPSLFQMFQTPIYHQAPHMNRRKAPPPSQLRVPYPQTAESAQSWLRARGITVSQLARVNGVKRDILKDLLRGVLRGNYGQAHKGAIVLGLKPDEPSDDEGSAS